jgi:signal transduction histidine kinase
VTTVVHWLFVVRLGDGSALFLFAAAAAALTFWRGLGPGMLASSMGSAIGPSLHAAPVNDLIRYRENVQLETVLLAAGSLFTCWLIYRLRVQQEDAQAVQGRRDAALAFASHELRQPLSNIVLIAGILDRDRSEEMRTRATAGILRSATRLATMIDELADVSKIQDNTISVAPTMMRLQDVLLAAAETARPAIQQKHQAFDVDVPLEPPLWMSGDALRLEQVFDNLLSNASKYSPEGAQISISSRQKGCRAVVVVCDTGSGVRRDMLEMIFEPFVRVSPRLADGLGIGLTLARKLVIQHGGQIAAQSEGPGRGSAFVVELPLLAMTAAPSV